MHRGGVVIVGGGPTGIAAALMLARRGWRDVTVLEKLPSLQHEVATKSYVYAIDNRGRQFTDLMGLTDHVVTKGVFIDGAKMIRVPVEGKAKTGSMGGMGLDAYLEFMSIMEEGLEAAPPGSIDVQYDSSCSEIQRKDDGSVCVVANIGGDQVVYQPTLLIGADGLSSVVRKKLEEWEPERFGMHVLDSPSAGLRFKVLRLPPNPPGNKDGSLRLENPSISKVEGKGGLALGLMPFKDASSPRTANIILKPDHPFWEVKTADAMYECLESHFPQLPIRDMIPRDEMERFAEGKGGAFPKPQHCGAMHMMVPSRGTSADMHAPEPSTPGSERVVERESHVGHPSGSSGQAVLLMGDAVHCFPPDIGQGVNSALEDVVILDGVLEETGDQLDKALPLFEERRMPDIKALVEMMVWAAPYQYRQDKLQSVLWMLSTAVRVLMSKVVGFIAPPVLLMVQKREYSYREILRRSVNTSRMVRMLLATVVVALVAVTAGVTA